MKKFPLFILLTIAACFCFTACVDGDGDVDTDWRDANVKFYQQQMQLTDASGKAYYTLVVPSWDQNAQVLMHWYNDPKQTEGNLSPLYTSTVDVKYKLMLYDGTPVDSSYNLSKSYGDSILRTGITPVEVISGWGVALSKMHIGDSCRVVVPYNQGYGIINYGTIKAYSTLVFDIKLVGIPYYEAKP